MKRFIVVGLGHFGSWIAHALHAKGHEVVAIDPDADLVDRQSASVTRGIVGDATDPELLREVGAADADAAVVSTGENLAVSVLATLALKELGLEDIYVKVGSLEAGRALEAVGASEIVFPEREAAFRLAQSITSKAVFDYLPLAQGYSIQEVAIPDDWLGKTLRELALPSKHRINVVALHDMLTGELNPVPGPDVALKDSDVAIVVGQDEVIAKLLKSGAGSG